MAKIVLSEILGGFSLSKINANFTKIMDHLNNKVLYRDNPIGEINTLQNDVDVNGKIIYNLPSPTLDSQAATKGWIENEAPNNAAQSAIDAAESAAIALEVEELLKDVVDEDGNLTTKQTLFFTDTNSSLEGNFYTQALDIQSNTGNSTEVNIKSPFPNGFNSSLMVSTGNNITNFVQLFTNETDSALNANRDLGIYGQNVSINTSGTEKLYIANDLAGTYKFQGTAPRFIADFTNVTEASRAMFRSSTFNGATDVGVTPNGTSTTAGITAYNAADPTNASTTTLQTTSTQSKLIAGKTGAGSYKPLALNVGGADVATYSEAAATLGNMTASVARNSNLVYEVKNTDVGAAAGAFAVVTTNAGSLYMRKTSTAVGGLGFLSSSGGALYIGTTDANNLVLQTNDIQALTISPDGNVLAVKATGGLGYGAGAGGTVTQTTSTNTAVTLNRPCGRIDLFNAAVPIGGIRQFALNNNLLTAGDGVKIDFGDLGHGDSGDNWIANTRIVEGICVITLFNMAGATTSSDFAVYFKIMKGSNS